MGWCYYDLRQERGQTIAIPYVISSMLISCPTPISSSRGLAQVSEPAIFIFRTKRTVKLEFR